MGKKYISIIKEFIMNKENYFTKLCAVRDKVNGSIQVIGHSESLGGFARNVIPAMAKGNIPLNDLEILDLGDINPFTGEISGKIPSKIKAYDWKELYNFNVTNEAVKDESETAKKTDNQ